MVGVLHMITMATLTNYASEVSGTPVTISCDDPKTFEHGTLAFVVFIDGQVVKTIHLPKPTCNSLMHLDDRFTPSKISTALDMVDGKVIDLVGGEEVLALEHEAMHIALNSQDESCVEATAIANIWQTVKLFKLPSWKANQVMRGAQYVHQHTPLSYQGGCT